MPSQGTTTARGYGAHHKKLRKQVEPIVAAGQALCWRCIANGIHPDQARINPGDNWDLGHADTPDATGVRPYMGPEHPACNRATAGRHTYGPPIDTTRQW